MDGEWRTEVDSHVTVAWESLGGATKDVCKKNKAGVVIKPGDGSAMET